MVGALAEDGATWWKEVEAGGWALGVPMHAWTVRLDDFENPSPILLAEF